jgi:hypothetical protein
VENVDSRRRWGTEQRLEFIEFRLFWEGGVNRGDITAHFGVSVPQASNDLSLYKELAGANIRYDSSEKRYLPTPEFQPKFLKLNAERYLTQLKAIGDGVTQLSETWIVNCPDVDAMPIPNRRVEPQTLKTLLRAIRGQRSIEIHYQSMNPRRPEPIWRRITPHAFGHDGLRWHVRAFCHMEDKFKDFIISRCRDLRGEGEPGADAAEDTQWRTFINVVLEPNPALTESQRHTIALDYDMPEGRAIVAVRYALLYYFNKRLRLDVWKHLDDPKESPIVIVNREEFDVAVKAATA